MSGINWLPFTVVQRLEEAGIPQDSVIFYQDNRWIYRTGSIIFPDHHLQYQPIESLGPFGIHSVEISFILYPSTCEYTIVKIGNRELQETERATGIYAPVAEITLEGFARSVANIPENATHFCWLYPPTNVSQRDEMDSDSSHELNLVKIGGFAYFMINTTDDTLQLLRVNCLSESAVNGLTFEGPYPWRREFTEQLWNQKRFQPVTLPSLIEKGARYFAFINPYEAFFNEHNQSSWVPSPHGAFAYLFNEDHSPHSFDCFFSVADNCLGVAPSDEEQ